MFDFDAKLMQMWIRHKPSPNPWKTLAQIVVRNIQLPTNVERQSWAYVSEIESEVSQSLGELLSDWMFVWKHSEPLR